MCDLNPPQRQRIPKDGFGPRGAPDCYYTSRVLNSTFRYVRFVKKLRQEEEEQRKGEENNLKELKDKQNCDFFIRCDRRFVKKLRQEEEEQRKGEENNLKELKDKQNCDFFIRCDRRALINKVAHRVDLCLEAYQEDLQKKRAKLIDLLKLDEEQNIRKFVEQAQEGAELIWQDKKNRLQYLLDKRKKEHEDKYKDTPLSKCVHVLPCIFKIRAKEAEEIQLYQMKEKEARRMAEKEFDNMWHEVAMKESEALAARMEQDAIERFRRDQDCKLYTDYQLEQKRIQREKEKEMLKQETLRLKSIWENDLRNEEEAERLRAEKRKETARERDSMIAERQRVLQKQRADAALIEQTWDSLTGQGLAEEQAKIDLMRRRKQEENECNRQLIRLKDDVARREAEAEVVIQEVAKSVQEKTDKRRCEYLLWSQNTNKQVRNAMIEQIKDREKAREDLRNKMAEQDEYQRQVFKQLQDLAAHKDLTDAQARKIYQNDLVQQIEYNKLLKERALQEEMDQRKKCKIASEEYQKEINKMACRPFFSEELHPFMKQMAKPEQLKMKKTCPCSKPTYCGK